MIKKEYLVIVEWGGEQNEHQVIIRFSSHVISIKVGVAPDYFALNKYKK